MYNYNSGYQGYSRSVRSAAAIENFEVPISLITKNIITKFLKSENDFEVGELEELKVVPIKIWKHVAKNEMAATSWHHTSNRFNRTDHYDLAMVGRRILEVGVETLKEELKPEPKAKKSFMFGVIKVEVWGGSVKHPKLTGYEEHMGIIVGDWFFYSPYGGAPRKFKVSAGKTCWCKSYDSYVELTKTHAEYKNTKKAFEKLEKEVIK